MKIITHKLKLSFFLLTALFPAMLANAGNTWDGGGSDGNWSSLANWNLDTTPVSPTALVFAGTSQLTSTNDLFTAGTAFNGLTFSAGAGAFVLGGNSISLGGNIVNSSTSLQTINLGLAVAAVRTITLTAGGGNIALGGIVSGTGGFGVNGTGTLTLSGSNSYSGDTTMNSNTMLIIGNQNALGSGTLKMNGGGLQASVNLSGTNKIANNVLAAIGVTVSGSNSIEIGGTYSLNNTGNRSLTNNIATGTLTLNNVFLNLDTVAGRVLTLDGSGTTDVKGVVADGGASNVLGIGGTATVMLENANTYTGGTTLSSSAILILGNKSALGSGTVTITGANIIQGSVDLSGSNKIANNLVYTGPTGFTISGSNNVEIGGKFSVNQNGGRTLTNNLDSGKSLVLNAVDINTNTGGQALTIAGSGNTTIAGTIADGTGTTSKLTVTNTGITTLSGSNTYGGATTISAGMTVFANTAAKAGGVATAAAAGSIGLGVGGAGYYSSSDVDSLFSNSLSGYSMNAASGVGIDTTAGDFTYATNQSAARSLMKLGANKLILTGSNSYSGATVVNAGTLIINGSVAGSGVTVNNGATLGGSGTVSSLVTVKNGGTLSPGNSPGIATYSNGLSLETGAKFAFELNANTTAGRGTNYDGVNVTGGTFNLQSGVVFNLTLNGAGSTTDYNGVFWDSNQSWLVFADTNSPVIAALFTLGTVSNDSLGNAFSVTGGSLSFSQTGKDLYLVYTVPEPSTWLLVAGSLTCVLVMRRRQR